jgi:hypothetical protein
VSYERLLEISHLFDSSLPLYIVSRKKAEMTPSHYNEEQILQTLSQRPLTAEDIEALFDGESQKSFDALLIAEKIKKVTANGVEFYKKA